MKALRTLVLAVATTGAMTISPPAQAWQRCAIADGFQYVSQYDQFELCASSDGSISRVILHGSIWNLGPRSIGTYVVTDLFGEWLSDWDHAVDTYVESTDYGNMIAAQFRFRSGDATYCARWDFDPWNGYRQNHGGDRCPEKFKETPPELRPVSDLVLR